MAKEQAVLSADELVSLCELRVITRHIESIGRDMYFKELTTSSVDMFMRIAKGMNPETGDVDVDKDMVLDVLQNCICNEDGSLLLFGKTDGRDKLAAMPWSKTQEIFIAACESLGVSKSAVDREKKD